MTIKETQNDLGMAQEETAALQQGFPVAHHLETPIPTPISGFHNRVRAGATLPIDLIPERAILGLLAATDRRRVTILSRIA